MSLKRILANVSVFCALLFAGSVHAQRAADPEGVVAKRKVAKEQNKQQEEVAQTSNLTIIGATAFKEEELRSQLKEQLTSIAALGLTAARADDTAFLLELFYRKRGFEKANVTYSISGNQLRLVIDEGARITLNEVAFSGNAHVGSDKLLEFVEGPTREHSNTVSGSLPFVRDDLTEGADLVRRLYISEGFLNVTVQEPQYRFLAGGSQVNVRIAISEGQQYFFGDIRFGGQPIFEAEALRQEMAGLLREPYTDGRLADIPRRLEAYYKKRGYYAVKVNAMGEPQGARGGRVPVRITIAPGPIYYFDGSNVTGLQRLRPSFVTKRFNKLSGKKYNPALVDDTFRDLLKTGLFNILKIKPEPIEGNQLHLQISAEEAKAKEFGFSGGYGTFLGFIAGASYTDRNIFGTGRSLGTSVEYSGRSYTGAVVFEDPYFLNTDYRLRLRAFGTKFDFDGYSKFEYGGRAELERQFNKQYKLTAVLGARKVDVTEKGIDPVFLGRTNYLINTIGYAQTLDLRKNPLAEPRGFVFDNTFDYAGNAIGSQVELVRATGRVSYYLPFAKENKVVNVNPSALEEEESGWERWFRRSLFAVGARAGVVQGLNGSGVPIDERFYNGGGTSVRSFAERDLGPMSNGNPIGGEFFTVFNVEYTFPIYGELKLAVFGDAGNLLPRAEDASLDNLRFGVGLGLRYALPVGPLRIDYGVNPNRRAGEAFGAFHFSFGFAF
ncbi:MAG: BamA/TamA family outer membrane protein [Chthoniobacterales bacterium]